MGGLEARVLMKLATVRLAEGTGRELPLGGLESDMTITTTTVWGRDGGEGGREGEGGRREEEREREASGTCTL